MDELKHASVCKKEGKDMMDYDGSSILCSLGGSRGVIAFLSSRSGMSLFSMGEQIYYITLFENDVFQCGFSNGVGSVKE